MERIRVERTPQSHERRGLRVVQVLKQLQSSRDDNAAKSIP
jgi:hypothetical protein